MSITFSRALLPLLFVCFCGSALFTSKARAQDDPVLEWNSLIGDLIVNHGSLENPGFTSRAMAMMNLAMYDSVALSAGTQTFYTYNPASVTPGSASDKVAATQAAYTVLSSIYGGTQQAKLDLFLSDRLSQFSDGAAKTDGIALGMQVGQSIITRRANDGFDTLVQYNPSGQVGGWEPDPVNPGQQAWGPNWGGVQTFCIDSVDPYLPSPPPGLTTQAYADAYNEVESLGAIDSTTRTAEQTEIGLFWAYDRAGLGTPPRLYNEVLQNIAVQENNTFKDNVQLFAMASVAMADAGIVAWNAKFDHDLWRPVSGIRQGENDGNPLTQGDANWTPLGAPDGVELTGFTPPFPAYVSGHATFGGAVFGVLERWYGQGLTFSMSSEELELLLKPENADLLAAYGLQGLTDATRTFTLSQAAKENSDSRVYLGIHWSYDSTEGQASGDAVAAAMFDSGFVAAVPEPSSAVLLGVGVAMLFRRRSLARR